VFLHLAFDFWRSGRIFKPTKKEDLKKERYKKASLKKRIRMKLTSLHNLGNFSTNCGRFSVTIALHIRQPMLFFEQRARPPEVACPCSKNTGHTYVKS